MEILLHFKHLCMDDRCTKNFVDVLWKEERDDTSTIYVLPDLRCVDTDEVLSFEGRIK